MIEILEMLFVYSPIELRVIIVGCLVMGIYLHFKGEKNEKDY